MKEVKKYNTVKEMFDDIDISLKWCEKIYYPIYRFLFNYNIFPNQIYNNFINILKWIKLGFNPRDCWSLDLSIAKYVLPRLKYLKNIQNGYPQELTPELWLETLDKMIKSFELVIEEIDPTEYNNNDYFNKVMENEAIIQEGLQLFAKYYRSLWD